MINEQNIIELTKQCLNCKNPSCVQGCPSHVSIPKIIKNIKDGNIEEAITLSHKENNLEFICGDLCDHERQCMGHCILNRKQSPVKISEIMSYIGTKALDKPALCSKPWFKHIAVVGGGVCGLSIAERLLENGFFVTIFETNNSLGGVLDQLLPDFRYDKKKLEKYIKKVLSMGLKVEYNKCFGNNLLIDDLVSFDEIVFAMGATKPKNTLKHALVKDAFSVLRSFMTKDNEIVNKRCLVVGGGNTAMDTARVLKKNNNDVTICYRRDIDNSPAAVAEIKKAMNDGIKFETLVAPYQINVTNDKITSLTVQRTKLGENQNGRKTFELTDDFFDIECDEVIEAIGSDCVYDYLKSVMPDAFNEKGWIENCNFGKYYFAGDFFTGPASFTKANASSIQVVNKIIENNSFKCMFGGSFDPVTIAHESIIKELCSYNLVKEVQIIPNNDNYSYKGKRLAPLTNRIEMLKLISNDLPKVTITDTSNEEFNGIIHSLRNYEHPYFVLGDDCIFDIKNWIKADELVSENNFIVVPRSVDCESLRKQIKNDDFLSKYYKHFYVLPNNHENVSSSLYRTNKDSSVVSKEIFDYLNKNNLYSDN